MESFSKQQCPGDVASQETTERQLWFKAVFIPWYEGEGRACVESVPGLGTISASAIHLLKNRSVS